MGREPKAVNLSSTIDSQGEDSMFLVKSLDIDIIAKPSCHAQSSDPLLS